MLSQGDAATLLQKLNQLYLNSKNRKFVEAFNHSPADFDFNRYMEAYPSMT